MKLRWLPLIALLFTSQLLVASGIKGFIKDENNKPLAFATVFVQETQSGSATNENGYYEIPLNRGTYTITFQYLGYQSETREISIGTTNKEVISASSLNLSTSIP
jgi:hypothetical protein